MNEINKLDEGYIGREKAFWRSSDAPFWVTHSREPLFAATAVSLGSLVNANGLGRGAAARQSIPRASPLISSDIWHICVLLFRFRLMLT